jgi:hypothetical protein
MWTCPKCGEKIEDQFDSCWKCAAEQKQSDVLAHRLTWRFFVLAAAMAFLAPLLADSLHSFFVVRGGIRFYNAELGRIAWSGFWIFVALRGFITFLVIWFFARIRFSDFIVWCCCLGLWTLLDLCMEVAIH